MTLKNKTKPYVGIKKDATREVFQASDGPTEELYGHRYSAVIGPFQTQRGAKFMAEHGRNNPHLQTVADAERVARDEERKEKATQPKAGKSLHIDCTELHTWFERDRAHVELRSKLDDKTIIEFWDDAVSEAVEDGFLNPRDYHQSAYDYAKSLDLLPRVAPHYVAMSGMHGCLPDHCEVFESHKDAAEDLTQLFDLGSTRKARLRKDSYLELTPNPVEESQDEDFGAEYCEITVCDCDNPLVHSDSR
jgi:hypothetical protein